MRGGSGGYLEHVIRHIANTDYHAYCSIVMYFRFSCDSVSHMGGGSGGYLEHVMRFAASQILGQSVEELEYKTLR